MKIYRRAMPFMVADVIKIAFFIAVPLLVTFLSGSA